MKQLNVGDTSQDELAWTFNDFLLGFLMIVLMMASVFAFLSNAVVVDSFVSQCDDPEDPSCGQGSTLFGGRQRGDSTEKITKYDDPETAKASMQMAVKKWVGLYDQSGDSTVSFGSSEISPQKENIVFEILSDGSIKYRGDSYDVLEMKNLIQNMSVEKGVYLEAIVEEGTSFEVYKNVKSQLWDLTDAENWRDVVRTADTTLGIDRAVSEYGTTYVEGAELPVLREAPRRKPDTFISDDELIDDSISDFDEDFNFQE